MTVLYEQFSDYTEAEFLAFVVDIIDVNAGSEQEHHTWVAHFERVVQHPRGNGLIYAPLNGCDGTPQSVVNSIIAWRKSQGLPLFNNSKL